MSDPRPLEALAVLLLIAATACSPGERVEPRSSVPEGAAASFEAGSVLLVDDGPLANPQSCVESFEPERDYFPAKVYPSHAERFSIEYFRHYKRLAVELLDGTRRRYLLLLCGTPRPAVEEGEAVIEIPPRRVVTTSSTELPHLVQLGVVERLVGHDNFDYVSAPAVRELIDAGRLVEVGSGSQIDLERLIDLDPDLLLIDSLGDPALQLLGKLRELGIPVALVPSYLETSPLGRAEWMLYTAYFFNREDAAGRLLASLAGNYERLAEIGRRAVDRPTALSSGPVGDVWYVPGGQSYMARLLTDAGADYLWADEPSGGSLALDIETVYERALEAEYWVHPNNWTSLDEVRSIDSRFADLRSFRERQIIANDARLNAAGGNDYWESGTARPDLVLADLLSLFHPELGGDHRLVFHRRLEAEDDAAR